MTHPQIERILLQLKFTLTDASADAQTRQVLALNQVNNALAMLSLEQYAVARDRVLHVRHTAYDEPVRESDGDCLEA